MIKQTTNQSTIFNELQKIVLEIRCMEMKKERYDDKKTELMWAYLKTLLMFKNAQPIKKQLTELNEIIMLLNRQIYYKKLEKQQFIDDYWFEFKDSKNQINKKAVK